MALKAWIKDGKLVVDSSGRPILCEDCPCEGGVPTTCCNLTGVLAATGTITVNGVPFVLAMPAFGNGFFIAHPCGDTQLLSLNWQCVDDQFFMEVVLSDFSLGSVNWQAPLHGTMTGVCSPFYFRMTAFDFSVDPGLIGAVVCGVTVLADGLNYVDFVITVP